MVAKTVGVKIGRGLGKTGNALWNVTVRIAEGTGDLGAGIIEGAEAGWEERAAYEEKAAAARKAANAQKLIAYKAMKEAQAAATMEAVQS